MNKLHIAIILFISTLNIFSSCEKYKDENIPLTFEVPLSITPIKDTINIGDTLTLEANFPDTIKEISTGKYFKLENFDFKTSIAFFKLSTKDLYLSQQPGNAISYDIINKEGSVNDISESFGTVCLIYSGHNYHAKILLTPKMAGTFCLFFFSRYIHENLKLDFLNLGSSNAGGRKIGYLDYIHYTVNNGNTNYDLLMKNSKLTSVVNPNPLNIWEEQKSTYTFVVK